MIRHVREPGDQFGAELRKLRKAHGIGTVALSGKVGRGRNFIGRWERDPTAIPKRDVLLRVIEVLRLSGTERERLLSLADHRAAPNGAKDTYAFATDPDANLLEALLQIDHDWPSEPPMPNPRSERAQVLIDAAAWVLSSAAVLVTDVLSPFRRIRWPQPLVKLRIVPQVDAADDPIEIPEALLHEEMPFIDQLKTPVTKQDVATQSLAMTRIYRRLLFNDPERAMAVARLLQHWSYDTSQELSQSLALRFLQTDHQKKCGVIDVSCNVVTIVARRFLATCLWLTANKAGRNQPHGQWAGSADWIDQQALWELSHAIRWTEYSSAQSARDAIFVIRSTTWPSAQKFFASWRGIEPGSEPELEQALRADPLCSHPRLEQSFLSLAAVDPSVVRARARAWEGVLPPPADSEVVETPELQPVTGRPSSSKSKATGHTQRKKSTTKRTNGKAKKKRKPK